MIEEIFLAYANNILGDNPDNYGKIIEEIKKQKFLNYLIAPKQLELLSKTLYNRDAINLIYHSDESKNNCEKNCYKWKWARKNNSKLNCHECQQVFFIHMLDGLIEGKEIAQTEGYEIFIGTYPVKKLYSRYKTAMKDAKVKKTEPEQLWSDATEIHDFMNIVTNDGATLEYRIFLSTFFQSIIALSLLSFMDSKDKNRLRRCPHCKKFYIAKDTKRKICYAPECRKEYEREKKRKQRNNNPVKYI